RGRPIRAHPPARERERSSFLHRSFRSTFGPWARLAQDWWLRLVERIRRSHPRSPRLRHANVKSKAPLASITCWWSFDANIRKSAGRERDANVSIGPLARYLLQFPIERARSPTANRDDDDRHRYGDQAEHALGARGLQEEADDEAGKHRADSA